jgi:outer membrane lipoprotein-sorting protein
MTPEEKIERLIKKINVTPRVQTHDKTLNDALAAQEKWKKEQSANFQPNIWRIIMKNKMTKFAAAAVTIIAVLIGIIQFGNSSIAFGEILTNTRNAKTLTWETTFITKGRKPQVTRCMTLEPYYMRVELEDGRVWILDHSQGKTLVLDPNRKLALISSTAKKSLYVYNTFKNFTNMEGFLVEEVGQKQIDEKSSIGFRLTKEDKSQQMVVWADIETKLPILIEETRTDAQSFITSNIVFDVKLDETLFSMEPPEGYKEQYMEGPLERATQLASRAQSAGNMHQILKICLDYVEENGSEWPNSLYDLVNYGLDKDTLLNPRQPERENGYVYLKPEGRLSPSDIILYEAYDGWGDGINVGFTDGHIEFIKEESDFSKRLLK